jgi:signal transduction histidine kinase
MLRDTVATKKRLALVAGFMVLFLVVLNFTTFTLYRRAKAHLDNQLGARLGAVASGLAHAIEATEPDSLSESSLGARLLTMLHLSATEYDLSNVVVLTLEGLTVFDLQEFSKPGEPNPFIDLDFSAVTLARSGIPAYTNLYKSGDVYMKSAYAPILSGEDEVIGILGVEAGASFFDELRELTRAIALLIGISMVAVVAIGWVFYRQTVALDRAQAAVIRKENLATIGRMVASIAHDIRNPLSIINASAEHF